MKILLIAVIATLLVQCKPVYSGGYLAAGIGQHNESRDCPEFCVKDSTLGRVRIGYEFESGIVLEHMHISGLNVTERGRGLNAQFIEYKINF